MANLKELLEELKNLTELVKLVEEVKENGRKKRSCSVREINRDRARNGFYIKSFVRMQEEDPSQAFIHCRMNEERFNMLLDMLRNKLAKNSIRTPISPECRLALTLSYLSQGVSIQFLAWSYKMGKETVRQIILETSYLIWKILKPIYVSEPNATDFQQIASDYDSIWQFPHCVGSIDGKHIAIRKPRNSGALYFNYKKYYSIVLLAACDARYTFTYIDEGSYGGNCDGGIFANSYFGKKILKKELPLPPPKNLPGSNIVAPDYFVADAAFPLAQHVMKPFRGQNLPIEQENFNKRICRARQTIENSFGILVARWGILSTTINMEPENAGKIVLACVALHNFIMLDNLSRNEYCPPNYTDNESEHIGSWRSEIAEVDSIIPSATIHRYNGSNATQLRHKLCEFFNR